MNYNEFLRVYVKKLFTYDIVADPVLDSSLLYIDYETTQEKAERIREERKKKLERIFTDEK